MDSSATPTFVPILDDTTIATAMHQARVLGCPPTGRRCSFVPRTPEAALETLTPDGWSHIATIIDVRSYGLSWDIWFQVDSGEVRLDRLP
jgi:hypothetical protein